MAITPTFHYNWNLSVRSILVVEDFEPFRRLVCSTLGKNSEGGLMFEASDGLEAVRKDRRVKTRPNFARHRTSLTEWNRGGSPNPQTSPLSKIIFVSQESSDEVVQVAMSLGARGYVRKVAVARDLLPAIQAVCNGGLFVSSGLRGQTLTDPDPQQSAAKQL